MVQYLGQVGQGMLVAGGRRWGNTAVHEQLHRPGAAARAEYPVMEYPTHQVILDQGRLYARIDEHRGAIEEIRRQGARE